MYSTGIDLGGSWTKLGLVSASGAMLAEERQPAVPGEPLPQVFRRLRRDLARMGGALHLPSPPPGGVGIGAAAIVDHGAGWLKLAGTLRLDNCDLRGAAEAALESSAV